MMSETWRFRIGISPIIIFTIALVRYDGGANLTASLHIYKAGMHCSLTLID
jgi:hypothetical protein